jgi:transposase-like protein
MRGTQVVVCPRCGKKKVREPGKSPVYSNLDPNYGGFHPHPACQAMGHQWKRLRWTRLRRLTSIVLQTHRAYR